MSQDIINEVCFLLNSIIMGIIITFIYDFVLIWRRLVRHNLFFISLEDFVFWVTCAIAVFYMLYKENNGILRWFAVVGATLGMMVYKLIIGKHFVQITSKIIQKEIHIIRKICGILFRPVKWFLKRVKVFFKFLLKNGKKKTKYAKKKLTVYIKTLRITLCKH